MPDASPALALVCQCCRWPRTSDGIAAIRHSSKEVDWRQVMLATARHRVAGLVHDGLRAAGVEPPSDIATELNEAARGTAFRGIQLAAELGRLTTLLDAANIAFAVLKGSPLAMIAYGTLGLKNAIDIDLAVTPIDQARAEALLRGAGYMRRPSGSNKHSRWMAPRTRTIVELHHALVDIRPWLTGVTAADATRRIPLSAGISVPTFEQDDLIAYLCVHGAAHGWSRLKWLADFAALLAPVELAAVDRAYRHACRLGAGRCVAQGLLLASDYLGLRLDPALDVELRNKRVHRWLARCARRTFTGVNDTTELDGRAFATLPIHASHLLLGMRTRDVMPALADKLAAPARLVTRLRRGLG